VKRTLEEHEESLAMQATREMGARGLADTVIHHGCTLGVLLREAVRGWPM